MRLIYHPEAESELIEAARFYDSRTTGLGTTFLSAVDDAAAAIRRNPNRRAIGDNVRRYPVQRFPYSIYFQALPDEIRILAIKHHRRHPDYWRDRV